MAGVLYNSSESEDEIPENDLTLRTKPYMFESFKKRIQRRAMKRQIPTNPTEIPS